MIVDHLNRELKFTHSFNRIISLVPSQTELLVDLGLEDKLVGITKFCVHPRHLKKNKTIVGGTKTVDYDKIKQLEPDIILCNKEENTKDIVEQLSLFTNVWVSDVKCLEDSYRLINDFGVLFNKKDNASYLIESLRGLKNDFLSSVNTNFVKKVLYLIWKEPWMSINKDTFIHSMLTLLKLENVCADDIDRYPIINLQEVFKDQHPDFVLLSSEPYPFKQKHQQLLVDDYHINSKCIYLVNGEFFSWYGTRLFKAFDYFRELNKQLNS